MGIETSAKEVLHALIPPAVDAPPDLLHAYRWRVAVFIMSLGAVLAVHIGIACGAFTALGLPGFALASEVRDLEKSVTAMRVGNLDQAIVNTKARQCEAARQRNDAARRFATERLADLKTEYQAITKREYPVPSCDEL